MDLRVLRRISGVAISSLKNSEQKNGVRVMAVNQLRNREYIRTQNSEPANSPVASGDSPIGAKARMAITVAPSRGHMVCFTMALAASSSRQAALETDQYAFGDDNGVVHQHAQCNDQGSQGNALQFQPLVMHQDKGAAAGQEQDQPDQDAAAKPHEEQQHDNHDKDRCHQVEQERGNRFFDFPGLVVNAVHFHAHRGDTIAGTGVLLPPPCRYRRRLRRW